MGDKSVRKIEKVIFWGVNNGESLYRPWEDRLFATGAFLQQLAQRFGSKPSVSLQGLLAWEILLQDPQIVYSTYSKPSIIVQHELRLSKVQSLFPWLLFIWFLLLRCGDSIRAETEH